MTLPLYQKDRPRAAPVTEASIALFRLGEQCNNACPMCSNSGRPGAFFIATDELLRRADRLAAAGFRAAFVTGGEPTIHPGFWPVVARLGERGMRWHLNTHGRSFSDGEFARRAVAGGLGLAIVSLHSPDPARSAAIFGADERAHDETVRGVEQLVAAGARVIVNCVVSTVNLADLAEHVRFCAARFGPITLKIAYPFHLGKGGAWAPLHLPLSSLRGPLAAARAAAATTGVTLAFESIPNCILGDEAAVNRSRTGCGESHYLDDLDGETLLSIEHLEAEHGRYAAGCLKCSAFARCPGVGPVYADEFGTDELVPFAQGTSL